MAGSNSKILASRRRTGQWTMNEPTLSLLPYMSCRQRMSEARSFMINYHDYSWTDCCIGWLWIENSLWNSFSMEPCLTYPTVIKHDIKTPTIYRWFSKTAVFFSGIVPGFSHTKSSLFGSFGWVPACQARCREIASSSQGPFGVVASCFMVHPFGFTDSPGEKPIIWWWLLSPINSDIGMVYNRVTNVYICLPHGSWVSQLLLLYAFDDKHLDSVWRIWSDTAPPTSFWESGITCQAAPRCFSPLLAWNSPILFFCETY